MNPNPFLRSLKPAARSRRPGLRDPRVWVGAVLVVGCALGGALVMARATQTTTVWALGRDLAAGSPVEAADLRPVEVRFTSPADADPYLRAVGDLPEGRVLAHDVRAGELLATAALAAPARDLVHLPLSLDPLHAPPDLAVGDVVDVHVTGSSLTGLLAPGQAAVAGGEAEASLAPEPVETPAIAAARVAAVTVPDGVLGAATGGLQVTLILPPEAVAAYFARLSAVDNSDLVVVRRLS